MTAIIIKMVSKKDKQLHKDLKKYCKNFYGADRHLTPYLRAIASLAINNESIRKLMEQELNTCV